MSQKHIENKHDDEISTFSNIQKLFEKGIENHEKKEYFTAEKEYSSALEDINNLLGVCRDTTKEKLIKLKDEVSYRLSKLYCDMGSYYSVANNLEKSIAYYNKSLEYAIDKSYTLYKRAVTLLTHQKYEDAINDCRESIRLNPEDVFSCHLLGQLLQGREEYEEALEMYNKFLDVYPDDCDALIKRIIVYLMMGKTQNALYELNSLVRGNNHCVRVHLFSALVRSNTGDRKGAMSDLNKAEELAPDADVDGPEDIGTLEALDVLEDVDLLEELKDTLLNDKITFKHGREGVYYMTYYFDPLIVFMR